MVAAHIKMTPPLKSTVTAPESPRPAPTATPLLEISPQATERDDGAKGRQLAGSRSPSRSTAPGSAASDNRAAESATSDGGGLPSRPPLNLYQKLAAISKEVAVKATGSNAFNRNVASMSITDVERALGDLMAEHGVVTGYRWNSKPTQEGTLWLADLTVWLVNADNPDDRREDAVFDVANSPSAAVSYAIKRFYRAVFHLADEQDETRAVSGASRPSATVAAANGQSKMNTAEQARITRLNDQLPRPKGLPVMEAFLRDLPYDKALAQMTMEHERACGINCAHVTGEA